MTSTLTIHLHRDDGTPAARLLMRDGAIVSRPDRAIGLTDLRVALCGALAALDGLTGDGDGAVCDTLALARAAAPRLRWAVDEAGTWAPLDDRGGMYAAVTVEPRVVYVVADGLRRRADHDGTPPGLRAALAGIGTRLANSTLPGRLEAGKRLLRGLA